MSDSEFADVEALLGRVLPDPAGWAGKVLSQLVDRLATSPEAPTVVQGVAVSDHQELVDHNLVVSAALGACSCWGTDPECDLCGGDGTPGWDTPDSDLFAELVAPAVERATAGSETARATRQGPTSGGPEKGDLR